MLLDMIIFFDILIACYDFCLNTCLVSSDLTHMKQLEIIWYLLIFVVTVTQLCSILL